ncbi:MAG: Methionine aminopeptidase [Candidatus Nomurabacteria bacterium GW2011_GWF2_35_66]|uniref:Methionine aminopeptidase n=1 Tax=Candidatus Nomurabacteria bacterium GW2011_GWE1_35_16 TaxID=1618761 RepID=A0A0G0BQJ8_9BACT|nr:MAG: Methionine aminopeptidase [Candidatus Nomurabacteria bacterium GW2011_GWF1_34_20]KKP61633.1 MAG: Methionine aminopeptidase [Candidatus Nomurabacteria bacterium GW2011_GWE2_34_25]KKP65926.1 MAG: Methionine aminopeptidase [Candidatus Nomurabacteria bacterium GW2011_GWE1_35_16]KKP82982.1 MAG: Methionine aminopeptidase [Candidatus Nomurabacteria bacterium GW2011_GWF2_35_66]
MKYMSVIIKTKEQIEIIREGGKILAKVLEKVAKKAKPGISTFELDKYAFDLIKEGGDTPAFLNYRPVGAPKAFPASICISVNNEIVHGIPSKARVLKEGDIVSLDLGLKHKGLFTDHAVTVPVGKISKRDQELLDKTKKALEVGIWAAQGGATVGDVGHAIESFVNRKYGIVRELSGHGVGVKIHEDPYIPNYGKAGKGQKLLPGMIIAIEPMLNMGSDYITTADDNWTIKTADGSRSAHFEHTILITEGEAEILTK